MSQYLPNVGDVVTVNNEIANKVVIAIEKRESIGSKNYDRSYYLIEEHQLCTQNLLETDKLMDMCTKRDLSSKAMPLVFKKVDTPSYELKKVNYTEISRKRIFT